MDCLDRNIGASCLLCWFAVLAHGEAEWIQRNPIYIDEAGHHCCSQDCKRWDEQVFREEGDEIIFLPTGQRFKRNRRGTYRSEKLIGGRAYRATTRMALLLGPRRASSIHFMTGKRVDVGYRAGRTSESSRGRSRSTPSSRPLTFVLSAAAHGAGINLERNRTP